MTKDIPPRKVPMWQFFNENVGAASPARLGQFDELSEGDGLAALLFIKALEGSRHVLDIGCGTGFPGIYVASHVGELVGADAAPNMVAAARQNASRLKLTNASFLIADARSLPFGDEQFDGASMLGLLESMDWAGVHQAMAEVRRVLKAHGRLAVLDKDWRQVMQGEPRKSVSIRRHQRGPLLQVVERLVRPALERDTRYLFDPDSPTGCMLKEKLGQEDRVITAVEPRDLDDSDVIEAWYDEGAQFDGDTMAERIGSYGFCEVQVKTLRVWNEPVLFLTACRRG